MSGTTYIETLNTVFSGLAELVLPWGEVMVAVGVLTMAAIQIIKDLSPVRRWYQRYRFVKWFENRMTTLTKRLRTPGKGRKVFARISSISREGREKEHPMALVKAGERELMAEALPKLYELSVAGDTRALFDLQSEELMAQVNSASQLVVDHPRKHASLLLGVVVSVDEENYSRLPRKPTEWFLAHGRSQRSPRCSTWLPKRQYSYQS